MVRECLFSSTALRGKTEDYKTLREPLQFSAWGQVVNRTFTTALRRLRRDIKQRLNAYLDGLARPKITGIGAGEKLRIIWPGARETISGPNEFSAEALPLFAMLFPDQMRDALLAEVERMGNTPLPPAQRAERMKVLEEEVDQLQRVEEGPDCSRRRGALDQLRASGRSWRAGDRRPRRPRRVMPDREQELSLSAFECPRDAASVFANCGHTVAYVGGR